jgi:hypothetical protein
MGAVRQRIDGVNAAAQDVSDRLAFPEAPAVACPGLSRNRVPVVYRGTFPRLQKLGRLAVLISVFENEGLSS